MTVDNFRKAALALDGVVESAHMNHPDFRVGGKIFATLGYPDDVSGMVKLPREEQQRVVEAMPDAFQPVAGKWGEDGATRVTLAKAKADVVGHALEMAWQHAQTVPAAKKQARAKGVKARAVRPRSE